MDETLFPFYSFDTGAFINGWNDIFKPRSFGAVWQQIGALIKLGQVRAVDEVKYEILKQDDECAAWVREQKGLFLPLTEDVQLATKKILKAHPRLLGSGGGLRNSADPFVIALAMVHHGTVVTQETRSRSMKKPRIPNVCEAFSVPYCSLPEFVERQGWTFDFGGQPDGGPQ